ncbi:altronate dehydratase family protein [Paraburkholderia sp. FT54]|uniref:UxaA family hydrolase n=1 Tax=Paraburkholderia sp. FT54 TaxID=3074437 RepID=UPI002877B51E|nr:altronate dehydratase family protein [Paraburkholderia sp. FT54]WNC92664.1 altronate dehydratase family protein [Paraburkholderia sp. FT54]
MSSQSPVIRLHPDDNVVISRRQLIPGNRLEADVVAADLVPAGHKVATRPLAAGEPVRRYGQIIGVTTQPVDSGRHVHVHNLAMSEFARDYVIGEDLRSLPPAPSEATFLGIEREDGRIATRNYIGILTSVNCSATVARGIADHFSGPRRDGAALRDFPHIDGVVALTHGAGCATDSEGEGLTVLRRTLAGYAGHANFAGLLIVGLGCETNQISGLMAEQGLSESALLRTFNIQEVGGTTAAVETGVRLIETMLAELPRVERRPVPASRLIVGLQCGGSDGYSGITANPALGAAVDRLVAHGGTAILSETPEIYGAEHLLLRRAVSREVGEKLLERINWWTQYCERHGASMNNNPSAGNKAGGLTTILEKSLGAVAKGGTSALQAVYEYAQPVRAHGLVFMDTPGYDPVSATGQVAGGANLICFTTGRGSAYGCAPSPSIKLGTNNALWARQQADVDINCGPILDGESSIDEMGEQIFRTMLATASGTRTKSELHGYGQSEFVPWQLGAVM